jgi:hypothetical protein
MTRNGSRKKARKFRLVKCKKNTSAKTAHFHGQKPSQFGAHSRALKSARFWTAGKSSVFCTRKTISNTEQFVAKQKRAGKSPLRAFRKVSVPSVVFSTDTTGTSRQAGQPEKALHLALPASLFCTHERIYLVR